MSQDEGFQELDDLKQKLEEELEPEQAEDVWDIAHKEYSNGETKRLEHLTNQKAEKHRINTFEELKKKGRELKYDKFDAGITGIVLTGTSFIVHPIFLSLWIATGYKVTSDSYQKLTESENLWEKLDDFGPELAYYVCSTLATAYFFTALQQKTIVLENGGTILQILSDLYAALPL